MYEHAIPLCDFLMRGGTFLSLCSHCLGTSLHMSPSWSNNLQQATTFQEGSAKLPVFCFLN